MKADLSEVFVCHCSICRRSSGSNGMAVVVIANDQFRWLQGQHLITSWKKPGADWQKWFCRICGSPLPGVNDESRTFVPAGLICDGGESLRVMHHIWVASKAVWDEIGDAGKQHLEAFEG
ncbi:MAG: GFA family protein [Gammaproteobacteria bacterium]